MIASSDDVERPVFTGVQVSEAYFYYLGGVF